jgi:ADP-ribose 1''-phosphate phosphatase
VVLVNTASALEDLKMQLRELAEKSTGKDRSGPGPLFSCRFNAGLFGVPWEQTKAILEDAGLRVTVVSPPE